MPNTKIKKVVVLGAGSAGFMAAGAVKITCPDLEVVVLRSPDIKIIGVGEGSTVVLTHFLHGFLKVDFREFYQVARPTWKLGLHFIWGPRKFFNFSFPIYLTNKVPGLPRETAFYCFDQEEYGDVYTMMMYEHRVFERSPEGAPVLHGGYAYHVENETFVAYLETHVRRMGVRIVDDEVQGVAQDDNGITALHLKSGRAESADLYVDCSGFASVLLGKAMNEPFCSFADTLFCDRAVVGNWLRSGEPILPYTTCETMSSGWAWQIEHEDRIARGYVYSSGFISDEDAEAELRRANPKIGATRVVRFISGHYRNTWVKNVVAIGNASGFVEPLEATALGVIAAQSQLLAASIAESGREIRDTYRKHYSRYVNLAWSSIRDFLSIHYRFNRRFDTPFWNFCWNCTPLHGAEPIVEYYLENGPGSLLTQLLIGPMDGFGPEGYYTLLIGQQVPSKNPYRPSEQERALFQRWQQENRNRALQAMTIEETLQYMRSPQWTWGQQRPPARSTQPQQQVVSQSFLV
jgi:tryptophan halogenase